MGRTTATRTSLNVPALLARPAAFDVAHSLVVVTPGPCRAQPLRGPCAPRPRKGLNVKLSYGNAGIRRVNTLDFVASSKSSNVEVTPPSVPERAMSVNFDGWIFPRSGLAFVWLLEDELN